MPIEITVTDCPVVLAQMLAEFVRQGITAEVEIEPLGADRTIAVIKLNGGH